MKFYIVIALQILAISLALPINESMPPPIGAIASLIGKEAPLIAKEAPKLIKGVEKAIPKITKEVPKITKNAPRLSNEMKKALSKLSHAYVLIVHVLWTDTSILCSNCDQIVKLFKQNGVHADTVAKQLHLPTDVVKTAWEVYQATGKCQG